MKVLIIEDEVLTAQRLEIMLARYDASILVLANLTSVKESIRWIEDPARVVPELIFMDLHLEDGNAFEIIDRLHLDIPIIFTTAHNEYTLQAFKANSIDYLLKPIDADELNAALDKFKQLRTKQAPVTEVRKLLAKLTGHQEKQAYKERFLSMAGARLYTIKTVDIAYFFVEQKVTFIKTFNKHHFTIDQSLERVMTQIDPAQFFRVNRSLIVSLSSIQSVDVCEGGRLQLELSPKTNMEVIVSGDRVADFKFWLGK